MKLFSLLRFHKESGVLCFDNERSLLLSFVPRSFCIGYDSGYASALHDDINSNGSHGCLTDQNLVRASTKNEEIQYHAAVTKCES